MATTETAVTAGRGRDATSPLGLPPDGWRDVAHRLRENIGDDRTTLLAAGVAFYAFLSTIPALALFISVYGLLRSPSQARAQLEDLLEPLPSSAADLLTDELSTVAARSATSLSLAAVLALALALWSASGAMGQLLSAVGAIYEETDSRGFVRNRLMALLSTLVAVTGLALLVFALTLASRIDGPLGGLARFSVVLVGAICLGGALSTVYRKGPDRRDARWRWLTPGAVVAMVGWLVATFGFQLYVTELGSFQESYGALGAVVVLLLWLWLSALVILVGAHVNAEIEHQTMVDSTVDGRQPMGSRGAHVADTVGESVGSDEPTHPEGSMR